MSHYSAPALVMAASLLVLPASSAQTPTPVPLRPVEEPEAYDVYAAVLPFERKAYVVQAETDKMQPCVRSGAEFERWREVVEDFLRENERTRLLLPRPPLVDPYQVVSQAEIQASLRKVFELPLRDPDGRGPRDPWSWFYERFPGSGGYTKLSAVGFDEAKQRAMVHVAHACGMLCGGGQNHLLEKKDGAWRRVESSELAACMWQN